MGIDARILLKLKGDKPTDEQLKKWSWDLCRSVGASHFFISDGMLPEQYHEASAKWHTAFDAHPRYDEWKAADGAERRAIHEAIFVDIGDPPKQRRLAIDLSAAGYSPEDLNECDAETPVENREPGRIYFQDGDDICAGPGEWLLTVSAWTRYYDEGYERGDLVTLCAIAEWCEANIPTCEVWYGGDSSGVCVKPWSDSRRRRLRRHLYGPKGRDYFGSFGSGGLNKGITPAPCGLCVGNGQFSECGWGNNFTAVNCAGCGKTFETRDGGTTWETKSKDD